MALVRGRAFAGIAVVVALVAGGAAAAYVTWRARVHRVMEPVVVRAPDLFPADTGLFIAVHGMDRGFAETDDLWKRVEPTAAWKALSDHVAEGRREKSLDPGLLRFLDLADKGMGEVEARLGQRPDSKGFFETFGRYAAVGLVPSAPGGPPRLLGVTRLPDDATGESLKTRLAGVAAVKRREPPPPHGYPVFQEDRGEGTALHYGIGGGFLFVAEDAAVLDAALARLAALVARSAPAEGGPGPSLAADPIFRRGVPEKWEEVRVAVFLRRDLRLAAREAGLAPVDAVLKHAFVVAPSDPALALSTGAGGAASRVSWTAETRGARPWEELLPAGCSSASVGRESDPVRERAARAPDLERFRGKRLWKEIGSLVRDTPRLKRLLGEALPPGSVPADDVLAKLPNDLDLVAWAANGAMEDASGAGPPPVAAAVKVFGGDSTQMLFAADADPSGALCLASALDYAAEKSGGVLKRDPDPALLAWRLDVDAAFAKVYAGRGAADAGGMQFALEFWSKWEPTVVLSHGAVFLVLGKEMLADLRAVLRGTGASLASDPLFREASAAVPAGWTRLDFSRPGVEGAAGAALWRGLVESKWAADQFPPEGRQVFAALMTATEEACRWAGACRAEVTATYSDAARPAVTAALMDPEREKAPPRIDMGPAPLLAPRILPARTLLVAESRVDAGAAAEEFVKAFLRALPGGRATWNDLWKDQEENRTLLEGRLEALVAGARGETGIAVLAPAPRDPPEGPPGIGPLLDRLPSLVLFAQYRDAGAAFDAALETLRDAASAVGTDPEAFAAGRKRYDRGRGSRPFGTSVETGDVGGASVATLRFFWSAAPGADLDGTGVSVVRRGDLLFLVAGGPAAQDLAVATDGGPGTLADAVRTALPADFLPAESASLLLFREDGVAESLGTLLDLLVPVGPQLTLQGYAGEPPEDRVRAHAEGWRQAIDLVEDALRTGCWRGAARVREGDRWITVHRRAAEKGPPR